MPSRSLRALPALVLAGWAAASDAAGPAYDALFPHYVELCAVSQIKPLFAEYGGAGGHAVLYLKGACRRPEAPYPLIQVCESGSVDLEDPESGVGISVDKTFRNVNWVAVRGRSFLLRGLATGGAPLTRELEEETVREAIARGIFRGVELHEEYLEGRPPGVPVESFVAAQAVGTDYALTYGRTAFCARLPIAPSMLPPIVTFLNQLNRSYASGEQGYRWSGLHDNCTHTVRNSLAAAGIWKPKTPNRIKLLQLFDLAVPANELVNLAELGNEPLPGASQLRRDRLMRISLRDHGWVPAQPGALLEKVEAHEPNRLYDTELDLFVLEGQLLLKPRSWKLRRMLKERRHTDLAANLAHWAEAYRRALEGRGGAAAFAAPARPDAPDLEGAYRAYLQRQLEQTRARLARLR